MTIRTTVYRGSEFSLCCGNILTDQHFSLVFRNLKDPTAVNGNITQWIYGKGNGKMVTDDGIEIELRSGELIKMPRLHGKRAVWYAIGDGGRWISFNPVPHSDDYQAEKIVIKPLDTHVIDPVNHERHLVLLDGNVVATNQHNIEQVSDNRSGAFVIRISAESQITLTTDQGATLGLFWKNDILPD